MSLRKYRLQKWVIISCFSFLSLMLVQCGSQKSVSKNRETLSYLALGDSYTIGESVCNTCTYAHQLVDSLQKATQKRIDLQIIAKTGWTTTNLLSALSEAQPSNNHDLVTLLIGVNNQYQGKDFNLYEKEFPQLLAQAIQYAQGDATNVIVLSIPDYGYTPFGQQKKDAKISGELDLYNAFAKNTAEAMGVTYLYITDITRNGLKKPSLVASDGLHPSAEAYHEFAKRMHQIAKNKLD